MLDENLLADEAGRLLKSMGLWLATAESCSGGFLGHIITNIAGSSEYYLGGFIAYSNNAKERWLCVTPGTIKTYGAVSRETVLEMASGVRASFGGDLEQNKIIGISISGIAGPGGGTFEKPVGTVWIGISSKSGYEATYYHFTGNRELIKTQSACQALEILIRYLSQ